MIYPETSIDSRYFELKEFDCTWGLGSNGEEFTIQLPVGWFRHILFTHAHLVAA